MARTPLTDFFEPPPSLCFPPTIPVRYHHSHRSNRHQSHILVYRMIPSHLAKILWVQALEESDPQGAFLPLSTRHHATQQARAEHPIPATNFAQGSLAFLETRTHTIWGFLCQAYPGLQAAWPSRTCPLSAWIVGVPALLAGLLVNGLGTSQRVNLLNFPLLLLLLWNLGIYLGSAILCVRSSSGARAWLELPAHWTSNLARGLSPSASPSRNPLDSPTVQWIHHATQRFLTAYWQQTRHLWTQQLRQYLHLGAACMALGIVLGLYIRGLALDYQATWESTFLSANQVHSLLQILLGPAAWLLHYPFPSVAEISNLQSPQHGPAAQWIHLWALTTLAVIVIPRSLMAWLGLRSLEHDRKAFRLPLQDSYFGHLLAPDRGQGLQVIIIPYSYQPSSRAKAFLETSFLDLFGNLADLTWEPPVPFGQEAPRVPGASSPARTFVAIFNAGQTPEEEVHGEWLHQLQTTWLSENPHSQILLLLDEEPYRQTIDPARMAERRQAWQRLSTPYHLPLVPFDVANNTSQDQFLKQAQASLWPRER